MAAEITRKNHYVPEWYQRGFLPTGAAKLHILDLSPEPRQLPNGRILPTSPYGLKAPQSAFCEIDLYTTKIGQGLNDDIERYLFGAIDKRGAEALRALVSADQRRIHSYFQSFFDYLDTQKLRTPKGLDWILARYRGMSQIDLMVEMQSLRDMHCTMWMEGVREIVSAEDSSVKFIVSDHPITIYNKNLPPDAPECLYPDDPGVELIGSQTIYALDANHCLILTNLEYAQNPQGVDLLARRTNARFRGESRVRTDNFVRQRKLSSVEVSSINFVLKSRARKFVAAGDVNELSPEVLNDRSWAEIGEVLLPRDELWRFGGELLVGFEDGSSAYQDQFGRRSRAHEYLVKSPPEVEPDDESLCPCGNAYSYADCCKGKSARDRPSWITHSVRERNLGFCNGIRDILGIDNGKTWDDIRRELSDAQVKRIHEVFEFFWSPDTLLREILPPPRVGVVRAVFMGPLDVRSLDVVATGGLNVFHEVVLPHPFINASIMRPELSPVQSPHSFKDQTLRNVLMVLDLEERIFQGSVHLVPDPTDLEGPFKQELLAAAEHRRAHLKFSDEDKRFIDKLALDDFRRLNLRRSTDDMTTWVQGSMPDIPPHILPKVVASLRQESENDPLALLQPIVPGERGAQILAGKGFVLETGLYLASLTGSIVYCEMDAIWDVLHEPDGDRIFANDEGWSEVTKRLGELRVWWQHSGLAETNDQGEMEVVREALHMVFQSVQGSSASEIAQVQNLLAEDLGREVAHQSGGAPRAGLPLRIKASIPAGGFQRRAITRFLITYGLAARARPVPIALQIRVDQDSVA